jgi:hypothetical protein
MAEYVTTNEQSSDVTPGKRYYTRPHIDDGLRAGDLRYIEMDDGSTAVIRLSGSEFLDGRPWEVRDDGTGDARRMTDMDVMVEMLNRANLEFELIINDDDVTCDIRYEYQKDVFYLGFDHEGNIKCIE